MIKTILFDLDGTLLPMDQDLFLKAYFGGLVKALVPHGYDGETIVKSIWAGTAAMVKNAGTRSNEAVFRDSFSSFFGPDARSDEPVFQNFYETVFQNVRESCGCDPRAAEAIRDIKAKGYRVILATNPLFPPIATQSRVRWAGLQPEDFEHITTYDNSSFCKPNLRYYEEILSKCGLHPEECVMVKFCTLDHDSFCYWEDFEDILTLSRNPFFPVNKKVRSNVSSGYGYWAGYGATYYKVSIPDSLAVR